MEATKYTFWKLIEEFSITIPIIQRDYAQGRNTDKIIEIRESFLESIYNVVQNETESLDFDFIYGSIKEIGENSFFIPLDGQQRLTTLFLLHWYLSNKEQKENTLLQNFQYETRTSSSDFCKALVTNNIQIPSIESKIKISSNIENSSWFYLSWKRDPTIQSMLVMLDAIHLKFNTSNELFDKFVSFENPPITFQFIKLDNFGLTDNLYIKMNARGKGLSDFENFKAKFEKFLDLNHKNLQYEFSTKIDGDWTDLFWKHKEENVIDNPFIRYFYFITEMLYFKNKYKGEKTSPFEYDEKIPKLNYHLISEVYQFDQDNLKFLFSAIDNIEVIENIVQDIFSCNVYQEGKIALFKDNINLLKQCLAFDDFGLYEKTILFALINYIIEYNIEKPNENIKDYIRVVRNLLLKVRWQDKIEFKSNLRYDFLTKQLDDICDVLISDSNCYIHLESIDEKNFKGFLQKDSLSSEISKAKIIFEHPEIKLCLFELEDHPILQGSIHNFDLNNNLSNLTELKDSFYMIWNNNNSDSKLIRSLLTIGDYSLNIGWSALGDRFYFGKSDNWNTILTNFSLNSDLNLLTMYLTSFIKNSKSLQKMIDSWLSSYKEKDWRYYFVKYREMTSANNLYSWCDDFKIRDLSKSRLSGWHINPYVRTVAKRINNESIVEERFCYSNSVYESPLILKNDFELYCESDGWKIIIPKRKSISAELLTEFSIVENILKPNKNQDMIQVAVNFAKSMIKD